MKDQTMGSNIDRLPGASDAGCCTGLPEGTVIGASSASLARGFSRVPDSGSQAADSVWAHPEFGGVVGRPHGWER